MNVLVICEDYRYDRYIVGPIVEAMMAFVGRPRAKVLVLQESAPRGVDQATERARLEPIVDRYRGMVQLFLLIVDRDGEEGRRASLNGIEEHFVDALDGTERTFLAECAWQEVEVWALAGQDLPKKWRWRAIRDEPHSKEKYFEPWARKRGLERDLAGGRKTMGLEAAARYNRVRDLCSEDLGILEARVREAISA